MPTVRITQVPPGEAPLEVRSAWVGVELPLAGGTSRPRRIPIRGVLSGPKSFIAALGNSFRIRRTMAWGYVVKAATAVERLEKASASAAAWWRTNAPHAIKPWRHFVFPATCCELLSDGRAPAGAGASAGNPYAAPKAAVAEQPEYAPAETPDPVVLATLLLWITLGLGIVNSALNWANLTTAAPVRFVLTVQAGTFALLAWLVFSVSLGRNWARIVYLVMVVLGVPVVLIQLPATFAQMPVSGLIGLAQSIFQVVAMYLVFAPGRSWYRS